MKNLNPRSLMEWYATLFSLNTVENVRIDLSPIVWHISITIVTDLNGNLCEIELNVNRDGELKAVCITDIRGVDEMLTDIITTSLPSKIQFLLLKKLFSILQDRAEEISIQHMHGTVLRHGVGSSRILSFANDIIEIDIKE